MLEEFGSILKKLQNFWFKYIYVGKFIIFKNTKNVLKDNW